MEERDATLLRLIQEYPDSDAAAEAWEFAKTLPTKPLKGSGLRKPK